MQVKDVDTLYSDYMKVRDILKGNQVVQMEVKYVYPVKAKKLVI